MLFKSPVYSQASGSIAGITYSHNSYGMYTRARATPTNPGTSFQLAVRSAMNNAQVAWAALSAANKTLWNNYATATPVTNRVGESITLTGRAMYLRQWILRTANFGKTPVTTGPSTMGLTPLTPPVASVTAPSTLSLAFTNTDTWATAVGGHLFVFASRPESPGVLFFKGPYRASGTVDGALVAPTSPASLTLPFVCAVGQRIFLRAIACDAEGRLSEAAFLSDDAA